MFSLFKRSRNKTRRIPPHQRTQDPLLLAGTLGTAIRVDWDGRIRN